MVRSSHAKPINRCIDRMYTSQVVVQDRGGESGGDIIARVNNAKFNTGHLSLRHTPSCGPPGFSHSRSTLYLCVASRRSMHGPRQLRTASRRGFPFADHLALRPMCPALIIVSSELARIFGHKAYDLGVAWPAALDLTLGFPFAAASLPGSAVPDRTIPSQGSGQAPWKRESRWCA